MHHNLAEVEQINALEQEMLKHDQVECPVNHFFGPGLYIREVFMPAGTLAIGHAQRYEQMNIMLKGKVAIVDNGLVRVLEAPLKFVGPPGRKVGYVIEDTVWQNIYATAETDVGKLEEMFLDKSATSLEASEESLLLQRISHLEDQDDFYELIAQAGFTPEQVREQSENESDQIPFPREWLGCLVVRTSAIEGKGAFLSASAEPGELIAPARLGGKRTPAGRYVNHSKAPNAEFVKNEDNGDIYLVALNKISGCKGGSAGDEITVDYRQALSLSGIKFNGENL